MKKKNNNPTEQNSSNKNEQNLQGTFKSSPFDEIVFNHIANVENNEEKIKLLAHAISSINECVTITDANNIILFVNDAFVQTYGFSREELIGKSIDLVRSSNFPVDYAKTIRDGTTHDGWVGEIMNIRKDGTEFPISLSTAVVHNDEGVPIARIGISSDITERKKNEDQLRNSEESYRGLFNTILDAIYVQDKSGTFLDVNLGAEKMYGYKRNEFIGRTPEFLSAPGKNDFSKVVELVQNTFETGKSNSFEFWGLRKNGEIFPKIVTVNKGNYFGQEVVIAIGHDITELRQHELAIKESEERYKSIFHNSTAVMLLIDPKNGDIIDANNSACKYYGYSKEKITSLKISDINPAAPEILNRELKNAADKIKNHFFFQHKLANGQIRDVEVYSGSIEINGKKFLHSIIHDITEKKEVEEVLRSERELFIGGPVTVFRWKATPEAPTEYVSPNVKTTLGYEPEEFLSNSLNFKNLIHPDDRQRISNEIKDNLDSGIYNYEQQYRIKNKNGAYRWYFDFTRVITNDQGRITSYHGYLFDNTEQKEAEEALRSERELFIGGPVVTIRWQVNISGGIKYVSPNVALVLGYKPEEMLDEKFNFNDIIHPDDLNRILLEIKEHSQIQQDVYEQEYRIRKKEGNYIWIHDFTKATRNKKNDIIDLHGYVIDITSRKEAEEFLLQSERELRKTNKMKDKFFSIISHDLRSPFQGLIGMANILVEDDELTEEERKEFTQKLYEGLKTQFNFIDDLLTWNRVQRGVIEFNPTRNDLSRLINETISLLKSSIENKELSLVSDLPENISFDFDWNMIATVVRNLISNAIKFNRKGGNIKIILKDLPDSVNVSINDTGVGINKNDLKKLWGIDTHYSSKGTDGEGGTGLGLILCKEFIEKHGGIISVESEVEKGSTFTFTLPKKKE